MDNTPTDAPFTTVRVAGVDKLLRVLFRGQPVGWVTVSAAPARVAALNAMYAERRRGSGRT